MTTAQVVEMSVTVNNNSPIQDFVDPDNQIQPTFGIIFIFCACHQCKNDNDNDDDNDMA